MALSQDMFVILRSWSSQGTPTRNGPRGLFQSLPEARDQPGLMAQPVSLNPAMSPTPVTEGGGCDCTGAATAAL